MKLNELKTYYLTSYCLYLIPLLGSTQDLTIPLPKLVFVEGGEFKMGCLVERDTSCFSDEKPALDVVLYDYWIGSYEVTNLEYAAFLSEQGNQKEGNSHWYEMDEYALIKETEDGVFKPKKGFEQHPVNNITWYGATAYTDWLSEKTAKTYRLPTEAEWEFAARGGKQSKGSIYSGGDNLEETSWSFEYAINSKVGWDIEDKAGTFPVGQKKPNELGIYDMTGNLSEWVSDVYDYRYAGGIDPTGPAVGGLRIVRGGSWDHDDVEARNTARTRANPASQFTANKGFRVVMEKDFFSKIETVAKKHDLNGVVLIKKRDAVIYQTSFGVTDLDQGTPMTLETPFPIMSITKIFTSTLILQLLEEGKIDLDQSIGTYLPGYEGPAAQVVTIHQLLHHTSGIQAAEVAMEQDGETPSIYANRYSTDQLLERYCSGPLVAEAGTTFDYSNADYILLGKIIENIEGDTYENVLHRRLLDPLEMHKSGLITDTNFEKLELEKGFPAGYSWDNSSETLSKDAPVYIQNFYASGAMYATLGDLGKFSDALFLHQSLLSEASMKLLLQTFPGGNQYGYGLWVRFKDRGKQIVKLAQRPGQNLGINTMFTYIFDHDIAILAFLNSDKVSIDDMTAFIQKQIIK